MKQWASAGDGQIHRAKKMPKWLENIVEKASSWIILDNRVQKVSMEKEYLGTFLSFMFHVWVPKDFCWLDIGQIFQ